MGLDHCSGPIQILIFPIHSQPEAVGDEIRSGDVEQRRIKA
jgi:hypothetical protein